MSLIESVRAREILDSRGNPTVEVDVWPRRRRVRPGRGAERCLDRRARGARAPRRRRRAFGGKGVLHGRRERATGRSRAALAGLDAFDQRGRRPRAPRPRRHRRQVGPRRERDPRRRRSPSRARPPTRSGHPAVPVPRRTERPRAPDADDERDQRRRARRQRARAPGVHADAGRGGVVLRGRCAGAPRCFHALQVDPARTRASRPASATRAGSRPSSATAAEALELLVEAIAKAGPRARRRGRARDGPGDLRDLPRRRVPARGRRAHRRRHDRRSGPTCSTVSRSSRSRTAWPRTTGRDGPRSPPRVGSPGAARRRRHLRDERRAARARAPRGRRERDPDQGEPDRHAHRDARHDRALATRHGYATSSATAAARPRTRRSPTSPSRRTPVRSRPARRARGERTAKYNQLLRIEEELGENARFAGSSLLSGSG